MPFEEYFVLILRHTFGRNKLYYESELAVNEIEEIITAERKLNDEFSNNTTSDNLQSEKLTRKQLKTEANRREAKYFESTKESRKRSRKAAQQEIKAARKEFKAAKRRATKEAKESRRTQNNNTVSGV